MRHSVSNLIRLRLLMRCVSLSALCLGLSAVPGSAATSIGTIGITATVLSTCLIGTTPLVFGNYSGTALPGTATVTVTCTNTTPYVISLDAGLTSGATTSTRQMKYSTFVLNYGLYSNAGHTTNWGNVSGTDTVAGTGDAAAQAITVYGLIPAGQYVNPGAYGDTVTATLTY